MQYLEHADGEDYTDKQHERTAKTFYQKKNGDTGFKTNPIKQNV